MTKITKYYFLAICSCLILFSCNDSKMEDNSIEISTNKKALSTSNMKLDTTNVDFVINKEHLKRILFPDSFQTYDLHPPCDVPSHQIDTRHSSIKNVRCQSIQEFDQYYVVATQTDDKNYIKNYYFVYSKDLKLIDVKSILVSCLHCEKWDNYAVISNSTNKDVFEINIEYFDTTTAQKDHPGLMEAINTENLRTNKFGRFIRK